MPAGGALCSPPKTSALTLGKSWREHALMEKKGLHGNTGNKGISGLVCLFVFQAR